MRRSSPSSAKNLCTTTGESYWSNCGSTGGGEFGADGQSIVIDDISDACTMLIDLDGACDGDVTLYYYGT